MNNMRHNTHQPLWQLVQNEHESYIMQQSSNKVIPSKQRDETYICDIVELDVAGNPISYTECKTWLWWHEYQHPLHAVQKNIHWKRNELSKGIYKQWSALAHTQRPYCIMITLYKGKAGELEQTWQGLNALPAQHLICMGQGVQVHIYQVSTLDELTPLYELYTKVKGAPCHADVIRGTLRDRPTFDVTELFRASMNETIDLINGADYHSYISRPSDPIEKAEPLPATREVYAMSKIKAVDSKKIYTIGGVGQRFPTKRDLEISKLLREYYSKYRKVTVVEKFLILAGHKLTCAIKNRICPDPFIFLDLEEHSEAIKALYEKHISLAVQTKFKRLGPYDYFYFIDHNMMDDFIPYITGDFDSKSTTYKSRILRYHPQANIFANIRNDVFSQLMPESKPKSKSKSKSKPKSKPKPKPKPQAALLSEQPDLFTVSHERITHLETQVSELKEALNTILMILEGGR